MVVAFTRIIRLAAFATVLCLACLSLVSSDPEANILREEDAPREVPSILRSLEGATPARPLTLLACGDVLLSRTVEDRIREYGFQWPFRNSRELVSSADASFCNLENPASFLGAPALGKPANVTFRAPPGALFGLKWAGFDVVSLANNHIYDYGASALRETLEYLDLLGIARTGAGMDDVSAKVPAVVIRNGAKLVFLAYVEKGLGAPSAGERPGAATLDLGRIAADIAAVKASERPDYVIVSAHWGDEHQKQPTALQREFGRAAIDAGATVVLGHHPHVLQPLEIYHSGLIVYSLGNFIFDMADDGTYDTAALRITLAQGGIRAVEIVPLRIERYDYAPRLASAQEADRILTRLRDTSRVLGTSIELSDGRGVVRFPQTSR